MSRAPRIAIVLLVLALACSVPRGAAAHAEDPQDEVLRAIGVDERLGAQVPLDLPFRDGEGRAVRLGDYLAGGPVVLTLNYYTCPMLCPITLKALSDASDRVRGISLARDFRIVTVSIDPGDGPAQAGPRAREIHDGLGRIPDPGSRWPFLTGDPASIASLTQAVGFRYRKVGKEFAHPDVGIVLTPSGKVSRYLYGLAQEPRDLKLALVEAAGGRIGDSQVANRILLYCFHYDPVGKKYALYAWNLMKAVGALTLLLLGALYLILWRSGKPSAAGRGGEGH